MDGKRYQTLRQNIQQRQEEAERAEAEARSALEEARRDLEALDRTRALYQRLFDAQDGSSPKEAEHQATDSPSSDSHSPQEHTAPQEPAAQQVTGTDQERMWDLTPGRNGGSKPFKLKNEVQEAYKRLHGKTFSQNDITSAVKAKWPNQKVYAGSVKGRLNKLVKDGTLVLVKESGGGSDGALFREVSVSP